jgi:hypothetical protein
LFIEEAEDVRVMH